VREAPIVERSDGEPTEAERTAAHPVFAAGGTSFETAPSNESV
jgi:hypothetical protein